MSPCIIPLWRPTGVAVTDAMHRIANDTGERARFAADRSAFVGELKLWEEEASALAAMDEDAFARLGIHPFVPFMARLQLERDE